MAGEYYRCDRCEEFFPKADADDEALVLEMDHYNSGLNRTSLSLCKRCVAALMRFIAEGKIKPK